MNKNQQTKTNTSSSIINSQSDKHACESSYMKQAFLVFMGLSQLKGLFSTNDNSVFLMN